MSFHNHNFSYYFLVQWQFYLDCGDGLRHGKDLVNTHVDVRLFEAAFQLLVDFQGDEADAHVRLDAPRVKWNIGRTSIFDFAMRKARSTFQRLW